MPKDMQRNKVYRAEHIVLGKDPPQERFADLVVFVNQVTSSRWWGTRVPAIRSIVVGQTAGNHCGFATPPTTARFELSHHRRTGLQVLHSLAHFHQPKDSVLHGPEFAQAFLHLVKQYLPHLYGPLRSAFTAERIKTSTWSPEARAAAKERSLTKRFNDAGDRARRLLAELEEDVDQP